MDEAEYACENFTPQKFRRDVCKNCFQPFRLHEKKQHRQSGAGEIQRPSAAAAETKSQTGAGKSGSQTGSPRSRSGTPSDSPSPKPEPKVFQRFRVNREVGIDRDVPARERTPPQQLEGVTPGKIKRFLGPAPSLKVKPMPVVTKNRAPVSGRVQIGGATASASSQPGAKPQVPSSGQPAVTGSSPPVGGAGRVPLRASAFQPQVPPVSQMSPEKQPDGAGVPRRPPETASRESDVTAARQEATGQPQSSTALVDTVVKSDSGGETADVPVTDTGTGSRLQEPQTETQAGGKTAVDSEAKRAQDTVPSVEPKPGSGTEATKAENENESQPVAAEQTQGTVPNVEPGSETETEVQEEERKLEDEVQESQPVNVVSSVVDSVAERVQETAPSAEPESGIGTEVREEERKIENEVPELQGSQPVGAADPVSSDPPRPGNEPSTTQAEHSPENDVIPSEPEPSVPSEGAPQLVESVPPPADTITEAGAEGSKEDEPNTQESISPQAVCDESKAPELLQAAESDNVAHRDVSEEACNELGQETVAALAVEDASRPSDPTSSGSVDVTHQGAVEMSGSSAPEPTVIPGPELSVSPSQPAAVEATPSSPEQVEATPSSPEQVEATPSSPEQVEATPSSPEQVEATPSSPEQVEATPSSPEQVEATPTSLEQVEATPSSPEQVTTSASTEGEVTSTSTPPEEHAPSPPSENAPVDAPPPPPLPPGVPAPPPPPPISVAPATPPTRRRQRSLQENKTPDSVSAHSLAMAEIRGGVSLRSVPPPPVRAVGEEKIVDVASELRQRVLKQKKREAETVSTRIADQREQIKQMADLLHGMQGSPTFLNRLKQLLTRVETFLKTTDIPAEILAQKAEWPAWLVDDLREVLQYMRNLEAKIAAAERLCQQTLEGSGSSTQLWKVNPLLVERCVQDVVRIARELNSDESRYFSASQSFPVDEADLHALVQRAADAIAPLLDKLYEKALQSHQSVFDPTATKYDLSFRLQNATRLLNLCCNISDQLGINLQVPKHPYYSEAQLKSQELKSDFYKTLQVSEREGKWDTEEQVELQRPFVKRGSMTEVGEESQLLSQVLEAIKSGRGLDEVLAQVTPQLFAKAEVQLIKAAVGNGEFQVIDSVIALRDKCCEDAESKHKHDFDWLLEAVTKATHTPNDDCECVKHLVQKHSISINCQSSSHGNSILHSASQRQALATMATLVRLGADPLLKNAAMRGPLQLLGLKCFPPNRFSNKSEQKDPLFNLSPYINNPSLSDVVLISAEQQRFHAHRLVMCAQSPVFKTLLDSDLWVESRNKEIPLPTISSRVLQILLQYLYTGRCLFPREDLNIGVELMAAADQFLLEPMRLQCERLLSEKMDAEVVVPLYYAAFRYSAPRLLANCCHFLLVNYKDVSDPGHEALLHLLENQQKQPQK